jgi:hypothetical protein
VVAHHLPKRTAVSGRSASVPGTVRQKSPSESFASSSTMATALAAKGDSVMHDR